MNATMKAQIESILAREDREALLQLARSQPGPGLRYLTGRLSSAEEEGKWRAVRALGAVVGDAELVSRQRATDLLRRFFWALNDESGTTPYGVPEAVGEILATRPELQEDFLPILCALATEAEMRQAGPIERGVLWALGRVGSPVACYAPEAVEALRVASTMHPDGETRTVASRSLVSVLG